jgi:hypothetical protein
MKKLGKILLISLGFGLVVIALGFFTNPPAPAQNAVPVRVLNTPLPVQGTVNANITNASIPVIANIIGTPNVNVTNTVPVSGTVAVSTLPTVTLNGTSAVSLSNNAFSPVYVVESYVAAASNPYGGRTPPAAGSSLSPFFEGQNNCIGFDPVPAGFALVAETASLSAEVPAGTFVENAYFGFGAVGGQVIPFEYIVPTKVNSFNGNDYYVASASIRGYIPGGSVNGTIGVGITTAPANGNGPLTPFAMSCTVYGHLVPWFSN